MKQLIRGVPHELRAYFVLKIEGTAGVFGVGYFWVFLQIEHWYNTLILLLNYKAD